MNTIGPLSPATQNERSVSDCQATGDDSVPCGWSISAIWRRLVPRASNTASRRLTARLDGEPIVATASVPDGFGQTWQWAPAAR